MPFVLSGMDFPKILCMVFTVPSTWQTKTRAVYNTWGQRCYKIHYFYSKSTKRPDNLPKGSAVALDTPEGRGTNLTKKIYAALRWAIKHYRHEVDWYLKADDDAYFVIENLQVYLSKFNNSQPYFVGKKNKKDAPLKGQVSGGAGYLFNTKAVDILLNGAKVHPKECNPHHIDDVDVSDCMRAHKIYITFPRDDNLLQRMHCNDPILVLKNKHHGQTVNYSMSYWIRKGDFTFGSEKVTFTILPSIPTTSYILLS